ncbi:MAG: BMP family ABC transporter substrate-binding protein [Candidatus Odinarchaeota archaeon]
MAKPSFKTAIMIGVLVISVVLISGCTSPSSGKLKAGFVYVGPIGDYGWTNAHDAARRIVDDKYDWLVTEYIESVEESPAKVKEAVDTLIQVKKCDVIFTTSFGFMDGTIEVAKEYNDTLFFHCSGYKRSTNVGTYFADFYQLYYLNGLMAGALTRTGQLGYVGAFPIPEVIRHINAFTLGALEANSSATVDVRWINDWYNPTAATSAANALIGVDVDMLAFTEDSPTVVQVAAKNDGVYAFSHYSPMQSYGENSTISGQLAHWEYLYDDILTKVHDGTYTNSNLSDVDYLWFLHEKAVELGGKFGEPINTEFIDDLKAVNLTDSVLGEISAYDLVMTRLNQMNKTWDTVDFDPFTGPITAQNDTVMIVDGVRATIPELFSTMTWFVKGVIGTIPAP